MLDKVACYLLPGEVKIISPNISLSTPIFTIGG